MDPTSLACSIYDTFTQEPPVWNEEVLPKAYVVPEDKLVKLSPRIETARLSEVTSLPPVYEPSEGIYNKLQLIKNAFQDPNFLKARDLANPFEGIGRSIFMNRAAIKLANMDAIYGFTGHQTGLALLTVPEKITYCDVAAGPGGFTEYLQWRAPSSIGYGMTLKGIKG